LGRDLHILARANHGASGSGEPEDPDSNTGTLEWGFFDLEAFSERWEVPWGPWTTVFGMSLWFLSFIVVGVAFVPAAGEKLGYGDPSQFAAMDQAAKANFTLLNQVAETLAGICAIALTVGRYEIPDDVLRLRLEGPVSKPRGWLVWALWGIFLAPFVVTLASALIELTGYEETGRGTVDEVVKIVDMEGSTYASLVTVTGVLAPILEETVFRGFLLASLTKWIPTPAAVVVSATAFGLCHLSPKDLPQLISLGTVLGFSYVRSRNLLTPMIIHGTWNSTVLTVLYILASTGVPLEDVVSGKYAGSEALLQSLLH